MVMVEMPNTGATHPRSKNSLCARFSKSSFCSPSVNGYLADEGEAREEEDFAVVIMHCQTVNSTTRPIGWQVKAVVIMVPIWVEKLIYCYRMGDPPPPRECFMYDTETESEGSSLSTGYIETNNIEGPHLFKICGYENRG